MIVEYSNPTLLNFVRFLKRLFSRRKSIRSTHVRNVPNVWTDTNERRSSENNPRDCNNNGYHFYRQRWRCGVSGVHTSVSAVHASDFHFRFRNGCGSRLSSASLSKTIRARRATRCRQPPSEREITRPGNRSRKTRRLFLRNRETLKKYFHDPVLQPTETYYCFSSGHIEQHSFYAKKRSPRTKK